MRPRSRKPGLLAQPFAALASAKGGSRIRAILIFLALGFSLCTLFYRRSDPASDAATAAVVPGAGVHGFVEKAGPLDPQKWQAEYSDLRKNRTQQWLVQRHAALAEGRPLPPLQVFTACQVLVNHLYKVVYLRHAKTASSSLLCHFRGCHRSEEEPANAALSFEPLQMLTGQELEDLWRSYLVVTFVRNSYQRAVSSYRMMMRNLSPEGSQGYGWNDFCADPAGFVDVCMKDKRCSKKGANFVWDHIQPQHECMLTADGRWAVDFIGRTEAIDEDLAALLAELEQRRPTDAPPVKPLEQSLENVNGRGCNESSTAKHPVAREQYCDVRDYFRGQHSSCLPAIRQQYGLDVEGLQFGPVAGEQRRGGLAGRRAFAAATAADSIQR